MCLPKLLASENTTFTHTIHTLAWPWNTSESSSSQFCLHKDSDTLAILDIEVFFTSTSLAVFFPGFRPVTVQRNVICAGENFSTTDVNSMFWIIIYICACLVLLQVWTVYAASWNNSIAFSKMLLGMHTVLFLPVSGVVASSSFCLRWLFANCLV